MLINADCIEAMKDLDDSSIDMVMCDPPYGTTRCKWDSVIDLDLMWKELKRIVKPNGAIVLTAQTPFDKVLGVSNLPMLKYEWIWCKNKASGHLNAKKMPMKNHENVLVFYKKLPTYNPQMTYGHRPMNSAINKPTSQNYGKNVSTANNAGTTRRYPKSVQEIPVHNNDGSMGKKSNPTQKPVALMEYLIKTYTKEGETVLDFTMGSGTTGVACSNTNRQFIGIERDEGYFKIAQKRILESQCSRVD